MSALPYGSAFPQQQQFGSAFPMAPPAYPSYGSAFPSYDQTFQQFPNYAATPAYPTYVAPEPTIVAAPVAAPAKAEEKKRKQTALEEQLHTVKELEKQLEQAVHDLELEHVKLNQKHSAEFNNLFQEQTQVLITENQKVLNAVNDIPDPIMKKLTDLPPLPDSAFPPAGSSMQPSQQPTTGTSNHPMIKLQATQKYIVQLRKGLDKQINEKN